MVKFHLRKSKCDQFSTGADVLVGHSGCQHCPVAAILAYIKARSDHPGAFYVDNSRAPITKSKFIAKVRDVLRSALFPEEQFRWAQLLYRHSDYRDNGGDRGFDDPNPRQLAQCHVSIIHSDPARLSSCPRHPARLREHISLRSEPCHGACSYTIIIYIYMYIKLSYTCSTLRMFGGFETSRSHPWAGISSTVQQGSAISPHPQTWCYNANHEARGMANVRT